MGQYGTKGNLSRETVVRAFMPFEHECGRLRRLAKDRRVLIWYTGHGGQERNQDNISKLDIANMLGRCTVTLVEVNQQSGEEEWRAEGTDNDGRKIAAVVVADEGATEIKVVTAWAKRSEVRKSHETLREVPNVDGEVSEAGTH